MASGTADPASTLSARFAACLDLPGPSEAVRVPNMALTSSAGCSCGRCCTAVEQACKAQEAHCPKVYSAMFVPFKCRLRRS